MMVLFPLLRKLMNTMKIFYVSFAMAIHRIYSASNTCILHQCQAYLFYLYLRFFIFAANGMLLVLTTIFLAKYS